MQNISANTWFLHVLKKHIYKNLDMQLPKSISILLLIPCYFISIITNAQVVAFYNCENFYDTTHQLSVKDEEFLPNSGKGYSASRYAQKTHQLSKVIFGLGQLGKKEGVALLGVAEIENQFVLEKVIQSNAIKKYHYKYIHFNSSDPRGIDVALIYQPSFFTPYQYKTFTLKDASHFQNYATRDILLVKGLLQNQWVHVLVNHWPSRRGGSAEARKNRVWAATTCKRIMDSINLVDKNAQWIVMGDFNDNPTNKSIRTLGLDNPFKPLYKQGLGSLAFRDSWNLFDQILLSSNWKSTNSSLTNYKSVIYKTSDMVETIGKYAGYPKRTWNGDVFRGGYSDHFPVALIFRPNNAENPLK
jgi:predicted extracellular nuclease